MDIFHNDLIFNYFFNKYSIIRIYFHKIDSRLQMRNVDEMIR